MDHCETLSIRSHTKTPSNTSITGMNRARPIPPGCFPPLEQGAKRHPDEFGMRCLEPFGITTNTSHIFLFVHFLKFCPPPGKSPRTLQALQMIRPHLGGNGLQGRSNDMLTKQRETKRNKQKIHRGFIRPCSEKQPTGTSWQSNVHGVCY